MNDEALLGGGARRNVLLVEGSDDRHVFKSLLGYHHVACVFRGQPEYDQIPLELIEIIDREGIDRLLETLEVVLIASGERRVGIVVDADTDLAARWQSLRNKLIEFGYNTVPMNAGHEGTILQQEGLPIVGIWIMPDNLVAGRLEDFLRFLIPSNDLLWPMAENIVEQVIVTDRRFPEEHKSKALIHTWLAWQRKPGRPMGIAITARYLDPTAPHAQQLINWLRRLFELESL